MNILSRTSSDRTSNQISQTYHFFRSSSNQAFNQTPQEWVLKMLQQLGWTWTDQDSNRGLENYFCICLYNPFWPSKCWNWKIFIIYEFSGPLNKLFNATKIVFIYYWNLNIWCFYYDWFARKLIYVILIGLDRISPRIWVILAMIFQLPNKSILSHPQ